MVAVAITWRWVPDIVVSADIKWWVSYVEIEVVALWLDWGCGVA